MKCFNNTAHAYDLYDEAWRRAPDDNTIIVIGYYNPQRDTVDNYIETTRGAIWDAYNDDEEIVNRIRDDNDPDDNGTEDLDEVLDNISSAQKPSILFNSGLVAWVEVWAPLKDAAKHDDLEMVERYQRKIDSGDPSANLNRAIDHGAQTYRYYKDIWGENPFF